MPLLLSFDRRNNQQLTEIPVTTTPIFEGHLYIRNQKKQWLWRLFRFDGCYLTCLSKRKVKDNNTPNPLFSTPKQLTVEDNKEQKIKYYQLPEWTVDISRIISISVLKRKNSSQPSKCFSIRSMERVVVLKAHKQKDLERWLFVLTKMWHFAQLQPQEFDEDEEDNIPLVQIKHPNLSQEKLKTIEAWCTSLAELIANNPSIKPPPIEPIPDDDATSAFTDMTSVSNRHRIKRRASSRRSSKRAVLVPHSFQEMPLQTKSPQKLKKRRSDDVRNWMDRKKITTGPFPYRPLQFFQDAITVNDDMTEEQPCQDHTLTYHPSIQAKKLIQVCQPNDHAAQNSQGTKVKRRASMPLTEPTTTPCSSLDLQRMSTLLSPLEFLTAHPAYPIKKEQDEEEMSLADLQKSLRSIQLKAKRSSSVSSIQDLQRLYHSNAMSMMPPYASVIKHINDTKVRSL
ncbi:hypothetical protein BD560DRAFT_399884 [Blakeslea trispora]|nr:hypothetical protein BD560DRAFT_399884 [Blakeslea trispora]